MEHPPTTEFVTCGFDPRSDGAVGIVTIERADKRNALSIQVRDEISTLVEWLRDQPQLKAVVFTGAGDVFCSGFDLKEFDRALADATFNDQLWASSDRYHHAVLTFPLPTIAAVNGPALAGGFDLAVMCDLRVAAPTATFSHPEFVFGDVVYGPLHDLVGGAVARELAMTGRVLDAHEALSVRLVNEIADQPVERALAIAAQISRAQRANLMRTKAKALDRARALSDVGTLDL